MGVAQFGDVASVYSLNPGKLPGHFSYKRPGYEATPTLVQVRIKASKTDPFRKGVVVYLGRTDNDLCPVGAVAASCPLVCILGCFRGVPACPYHLELGGQCWEPM